MEGLTQHHITVAPVAAVGGGRGGEGPIKHYSDFPTILQFPDNFQPLTLRCMYIYSYVTFMYKH